MITVTVNNRQIEAEENSTVLQAAQKLGIEIPTLCYHPALEPYGACRVCIVEIVKGPRPGIVTACTYPVEDGMMIETDSEKAIEARKFSIELLLARCPKSEKIQQLAKQYDIEKPRFSSNDTRFPISDLRNCILCGLCVRVCKELIGADAISFANRGSERQVVTPFNEPSETCIACGACAFVCPTNVIKYEDVDNYRRMITWHTEREMQQCQSCGKYFVPELLLDRIKQKTTVLEEIIDNCPECRKQNLTKMLRR